MKTFPKDAFEFRKARIVYGNKGGGVGIMGGLIGPDGMGMEVTENLFGYEGWGITSGVEGLGEVSDVGVEVIWVTADGQSVENGAFGG